MRRGNSRNSHTGTPELAPRRPDPLRSRLQIVAACAYGATIKQRPSNVKSFRFRISVPPRILNPSCQTATWIKASALPNWIAIRSRFHDVTVTRRNADIAPCPCGGGFRLEWWFSANHPHQAVASLQKNAIALFTRRLERFEVGDNGSRVRTRHVVTRHGRRKWFAILPYPRREQMDRLAGR